MADVSVTPPLRNVIEGIIAADRVAGGPLPAVVVADAILAIPEIAAGLAALRNADITTCPDCDGSREVVEDGQRYTCPSCGIEP